MAFWQKLFSLKTQDDDHHDEAAYSQPSTPSTPQVDGTVPEVLKSVRGQHPNLSNFHKRTQSMIVTPHPPGQFESGLASTSTPRSASPTKRSFIKFIDPTKMISRGRSLDLDLAEEPHADSFDSVVVISGHDSEVQSQPAILDELNDDAHYAQSDSADFQQLPSSPILPYESPAAARASRMFQQSVSVVQSGSGDNDVQRATTPSGPPPSSVRLPASNPQTPANALGFRSILRAPQTPGTGQSIRFSERNAYRIISPEASSVSSTSRAEVSSVERHLHRRDDHPSPSFLDMHANDLLGSPEDNTGSLSGFAFPQNSTPAQHARRLSPDLSVPQPSESSQSSSLLLTHIPQVPDDMSNLNQLDLSLVLDDSQLDSRRSSEEEVAVPPFARLSPRVSLGSAVMEDEPSVVGQDAGPDSTVYHSTVLSPARISIESPEGERIEQSRSLSFSEVPHTTGMQGARVSPTSSTRLQIDFNEAGPSRIGTPLGSTPDASAYLPMAESPLPTNRVADDSRRSLGVGRQLSQLSITHPVPSMSSATSSSSLGSNSSGPSVPSVTSSEPEQEYIPGRVFSRTMQPVEGTIAAIPESRSTRTIVGQYAPMTPDPSCYDVTMARSYPVTPDRSLADRSLAIPGKFKFDISSYRAGSPSIMITDDSPFENAQDAHSVFEAYESALNHLRSQNHVLSQLDEMRSSEKRQIREWVGDLMQDLRLLTADGSDDGQPDTSKTDADPINALRAENEEMKHAVAAAEAALQAEQAKRVLWEQDKQELEIRWEQERQRFEKEVHDAKEELENARETGDALQEKNTELQEMREAFAAQESEMDDLRGERDHLVESNSSLRRELHGRSTTDREVELLRAELAAYKQREEEFATRGNDEEIDALQTELRIAKHQLSDLQQKNTQLERDVNDQRSRASEAAGRVKVLQAELEAQWANTEKATARIEELETDKRNFANQLRNLKQDTQAKESEAKRELASQLREAWEKRDAAEQERETVTATLEAEIERTKAELEDLQDRYQVECQEHDAAQDEFEELVQSQQTVLKERDDALQSARRLEELLHKQVKELSAATGRVLEREKETDALRGEMTQLRRQCDRELQEQRRELDDAVHRASQAEAQLNNMIRQRVTEDVMSEGMQGRLQVLNDECAKLRKEVMELHAVNADKELMLTKLAKAKEQYKEDKEGLNVALEAKQHELDLLKRKYGLKGVAGGNTPVPNRVSRPPSRESLPFTPAHRPSSSLAESKDRRTTLGADPLRTSVRSTTSLAARRYSTLATPTPAALPTNSLSKSQSIAPAPRRPSSLAGSNTSHRRVSSGGLPARGRIPEALRVPSGMTSLQSVEDKENEEPVEEPRGDSRAKRRSMVAA